ncbi:MAG: Spheroidene monooxygenase [Pseudomonadota bacterium]|jgi:spheroidene monooxygenase
MSTSFDLVKTDVSGVVVVVLVDYLRQYRGWGWMRLMAGNVGLKNIPGLLFSKVMGSGHGGGFSIRPSSSHQGLICRFSNIDSAMKFLKGPQVRAMREHARESWSGLLAVTSSRGAWDQSSWPLTDEVSRKFGGVLSGDKKQPLAVLTRASIVPSKTMSFWRYAPAAQAELDQAKGCLLAMGLGEIPLVRQCTFSLWEDKQAMRDYAFQGAHQTAISASYRNDFFSESLFVHMQVLGMSGQWMGQDFGDDFHFGPIAANSSKLLDREAADA